MDILKALSPVVPVFMLIGVGFVFAQWKRISLRSVTEIIVYLGIPALVFSSLASRPLFAGDIAVLFGGMILIFGGVGLLNSSTLSVFDLARAASFSLVCL
jgi:predicted permease